MGMGLDACLRKDDFEILTDLQVQSLGAATFVGTLLLSRSQDDYFKAHKKCLNDSQICTNHTKICFAGIHSCPPDIRERLTNDHFLGAVHDKDMKIEIWRLRTWTLHEAVRLGFEWGAVLCVGVRQKTDNLLLRVIKSLKSGVEKTAYDKIDLLEANSRASNVAKQRIVRRTHKDRPNSTTRTLIRGYQHCWISNVWERYQYECTKPLDSGQRRKSHQWKKSSKKIENIQKN
ncbi:hypothetical protein CHS0354_003726 [Potamilus streckersoni]|uniref:Uncharacterized protein n=1 Tax=Potamilus streckersoni TaxID=2493646 RepID=A0AAE0VY66_9BIVA|nr:hypothetical protein CHS0354_003726 [Potamilus streckersoni]